jgi:methionine-rich copper-binding protein CopC
MRQVAGIDVNNYTQEEHTMMKLINSLFLASLVALVPSVLLAHADLTSSSPGNDAVLNKSPEKLELTFTEDVQLLKLAISNSDGSQEVTSFTPTANAQTTFAVPLSELTQGVHTVSFTILGDDGHRVEKRFMFTVDAAAHESAGTSHAAHAEGH